MAKFHTHQPYPNAMFSKEQQVAKTPNLRHNSFTAPPPIMSYVPSYLTAPLTAPGALPLINRMVLAPLTRGRAGASRVANATIAEYYRQRAGFGLIVTEVRFPRLPVLPQPPCAGLSLITHRVPVTTVATKL